MLAAAQWSLASTGPNEASDPAGLGNVTWSPATVPGTAHGHDLDDRDWWYRGTFEYDDGGTTLRFHGLATIAQVWLNGTFVLESNNMFERHSVDVASLLQPQNELVLCFRSLNAALTKKRPRPRWKTRLVRQQQLRWFRTSLLGRIPGWTPPTPIVGPWRAITLGTDRDIELRPYLDGTTGVVDFSCATNEPCTLSVGGTSAEIRGSGQLRIENAELWWPHTHGTPFLYDCSARFGDETVDCGRIGFRNVEMSDQLELRVNGLPVFCRGACWTQTDNYEQTLTLMRDAGANMIRVGGTMVYEADRFYELCDALGIMVWQDFMFANMDYPADDAQFAASVRTEATQQLQRLRRHPAVVMYCGNSEVEQQAAMLGAPRELWRNALFAEVLPQLCAGLHPDSLYVPSSPSGGALPFHTGAGVTHYYGVGAYKRPIADARRARVRFTSETLGFANVPEKDVVDLVMEGDAPALHDPRWKARTPRDTGAGWDFEDVRDHYLRELFSADPAALRYSDTARYLELSRVTTGEVMSRVFSEWRSTHSTTHGGLVWFLQDLWPGAGWGILDSRAIPKACFYYLRRVWQPRTVVFTDEGLDGLHAHVVNETAEPLTGTLELTLLRDGQVIVAQATAPCEVAARSTVTFESDAMLGAFYDVAYAYRFGSPKHDVTIATLLAPGGGVIAEAFHFPIAAEPKRALGATVTADARQLDDGRWDVTLTSDRFLYAAHFDTAKLLPSDNYFHVVPNRVKHVILASGDGSKPRGFVEALNLDEAVRIVVHE
ncbi:MAG TPA: glycoside hydrolase family 2 protein [Thermoanaerobaculia bacterium]|jgi:beta-mannosidase